MKIVGIRTLNSSNHRLVAIRIYRYYLKMGYGRPKLTMDDIWDEIPKEVECEEIFWKDFCGMGKAEFKEREKKYV